MVWLYAYIAIGIILAFANLLTLNAEGKTKDVGAGGVIAFFVLFIVLWPSVLLYKIGC